VSPSEACRSWPSKPSATAPSRFPTKCSRRFPAAFSRLKRRKREKTIATRRKETGGAANSAYEDSDSERERDRRKKDRSRRAKSAGRSSSRSLDRGRHHQRSSDLDGQYSDSRDMDRAEQGEPYFPPPPTSDYRPYNPQEYAAGPQGDYRPASPGQPYGYAPPQVNDSSRSRTAGPTWESFSRPVPTPPMTCPPMLMNRPSSNLPSPLSPPPAMFDFLHRGTPVTASFSPSYAPPLAALFSRPLTNTPKPAAVPPPHSSASASRYTPGPGYAPSPPVNTNIPAPPTGVNAPYPPYNPAEFASNGGGYQAPGNAYPSPPPLNRQRSNSQPASPPYPTYIPPSADQRMSAYDTNQPSSRRGSTKPRREHRHRARSADTHSSRYEPDHRQDSSRMTKMRERFDDGLLREPTGLAAAVGGALAGAFAGRQMGKSRLTTVAGAAAGAIGGGALANKRSK
jgi:hypothetical protein